MKILRRDLDVFTSEDMAPLRDAVVGSLSGVHPELKFKVGDITYDQSGAYFRVRVSHVDDIAVVAENRGLKFMEKVGEYTLADYDPADRKKPFILRDSNGVEYRVGPSWVKKVFGKSTAS